MMLTLALVASLAVPEVPDCEPTLNSSGLPARLDQVGPEVLRASQLPPNRFTILTGGPIPWNVPFGDGVSCVNPAVGFFRTPAQPTGEESIVEWNIGGMEGQSSNGLLYFQTWYRDPGFGSFEFNLSNRVEWIFDPEA